MSTRLHNVIFAVLLGIILGITAYALDTRTPEMEKAPLSIEVPVENPGKNRTETERMIDAGELSDHPAKYYRVIDE